MQDQKMEYHILPDHDEHLGSTFAQISRLLEENNDTEARSILTGMHHADFADFLDNSNSKIHKRVISILGDAFKPETLVWLSKSAIESLSDILSAEEITKLIDKLDTEDAIEVIEEFGDLKDTILLLLSKEKREHIIEGFAYPEHSVGRVMEKQFVSIIDHWTVGQAVDHMRKLNIEHDFHAAIIVDTKQKPVGHILLCTLIKSGRNENIRDLMNDDFKIAETITDLDQLSYIFRQYALTVVPVTNKAGKLVGTVSINNMIYIVEQRAEEEAMHLGGVSVKDTFHSMLQTAAHRFPWLFVSFITACITSDIINQFSGTIAQLITIASIMPIVASISGTAGTQVMTVTVMALIDKDITSLNSAKIVLKELLVCTFNGFILAFIAGSAVLFIFNNTGLGVIFAVAIIINFSLAGFLGSFVPIALDHFDFDPAIASSVLLTSLTDSLGFLTFLALACTFLV